MDECQVEEAVAEFLGALLYQASKDDKSSDMYINVGIKCQAEYNGDSQELFRIKISCGGHVNVKDLSRRRRMTKMAHLIHRMQLIENQSHFYVVIPDKMKDCAVTESFLAEQTGSCSYNLVCQNSKLKLGHMTDHTTIHIRIYQRKVHMLRECKTMYSFLRNLHIFKPKLKVTFNLIVGDSACYSSFEQEKITKLSDDLEITSNPEFYVQDDCFHPVQNTSIQCKTSIPRLGVELDEIDLPKVPVYIMVAGFYLESKDTNQRVSPFLNGYGSVTINVFGVNKIPIPIKTENIVNKNILHSVCWEKYGFELIEMHKTAVDANCSYSQKATVMSIDNQLEPKTARNNFEIFLFILFDLNITASPNEQFLFQQWLRKHYSTWNSKPKIKECSQTAMESVLDQLLVFSKHENEPLVSKLILDATNSISNIIERSRNERFISQCIYLMEVETKDEIKQKVQDCLSSVAPLRVRRPPRRLFKNSVDDQHNSRPLTNIEKSISQEELSSYAGRTHNTPKQFIGTQEMSGFEKLCHFKMSPVAKSISAVDVDTLGSHRCDDLDIDVVLDAEFAYSERSNNSKTLLDQSSISKADVDDLRANKTHDPDTDVDLDAELAYSEHIFK